MSDTAKIATVPSVNPFRINIGPEDAIEEDGWSGAADIALALLLAGPVVVVLLGAAGTGKTLLLADLERRFRSSGRGVTLIRDGLLHQGADNNSALLPPDETNILLIDDARDGEGVAEALQKLGRRKCVIAAQPEFEDCLLALPVSPAIIRLHPLEPTSARRFITEMLRRAGKSPDLFSKPAMDRIVQEASGIPRHLCAASGAALQVAASAGEDRVMLEHVEQALQSGCFALADAKTPPPARSAPAAAANHPSDDVRNSSPVDVLTVARPEPSFVARPNDRVGLTAPAAPRRNRAVWLLAPLAIACIATFLWTRFTDRPAEIAAAVPVAAPSAVPVAPTDAPQVPVAPTEPTPAPPNSESRSAPKLQAAGTVPSTVSLPATPTRLVISYARGDSVVAGPAARLAKALGRAGYVVGVPVPTPDLQGRPSLSVFYVEDQPAAAALRDGLGQDAPAVRLVPSAGSGYRPRPGTIELSLAGNPAVDRWAQAIESSPSIAASGAIGSDTPLPGATPGDGATIAPDNRRVRVTWKQTEPNAADFLEVVELGPRASRTVFAGFVERAATEIELGSPGAAYAWRVFSVRPDSMHYVQSRWYRFTVEGN